MQAIDCAGLQLDSLKGQPGMAPMRGDSYRQCAFVWRFFSLLVSEGVRRESCKGGPRRNQGGGGDEKMPWSFSFLYMEQTDGADLECIVFCDPPIYRRPVVDVVSANGCVLPNVCFET